jgi:hypothetical protein
MATLITPTPTAARIAPADESTPVNSTIVDADLGQRRPRGEVVAAHHQPARALRHPPHAEGERQCRQAAEAQHPAPAFDVVEGEPDQVGGEDADRHRELEEADQAPAALRRRDLGDVDGGGSRGEADCDADHDPGYDQHLGAGGRRAGQGARDEDEGCQQDHQAAAVAVGRGPGKSGAGDGSDRHRGDDQTLGEAAEAEVALDEEQSPGDHTGVVAEEQPAEPGDRCSQDYVAPCPTPRGLHPVAHPGATV